MSRERLARIALRAYPPSARASRGEEMLATLLDASAGSRRRLLREVADLVRLGLNLRATQTASEGPGRLIADGVRLAAVWLMTVDLVVLLSWRYRGMQGPLVGWPSIALLVAALAVALVGLDRLAGVGALLWTAMRLPDLLQYHSGVAGLAPEVLPVVCFVVMVLAPRPRRPHPSGPAWLVVALALVVTFAPPNDERNPLLLAMAVLGALLAVVFALAMLPTDPRLAIAGAVGLSDLAVGLLGTHQDAPALAYVAATAAPAAVAFTIARTRQLRRERPV